MRAVEAFGEAGHFFEGPRWHDGRWWASDLRGGVVRSFSIDGTGRDELQLEDHPSGLGWMPDGSLLVVSMTRRAVLRRRPGRSEAEVHADLDALCGDKKGFLNDMIVDAEGGAYVGFDPDFGLYGSDCEDGLVLRVDPDGAAYVAGRGLMFPNGMVIKDGRELIVAETEGQRFSSYPIQVGGALGPRSLWADVSTKVDRRHKRDTPLGTEVFGLDGCDLDAEGHIWTADWRSNCFRFAPDGSIVDEVILPAPYRAWACALGGEDGRTLLICGADHDTASRMKTCNARLFTARVDVPGAAWSA